MATINMDSILSKAQHYLKNDSGKTKIHDTIDKVVLGKQKLQLGSAYTPDDAADKFIQVLVQSINSSGLSSEAIEAVSGIQHGDAVNLGNNTYLINVYFAGDYTRPSLDEARYGSINDIVALLNNGVGHTMRPVYGTWHGKETWSRTVIPGAHFVEQATTDFMGNYSTEYHVTNITVNGI